MIGPDQEYYFMGVVITLGLVLVYSAGNWGVYRFYRTEKRHEFRAWKHVLCPAFSTAALVWVGVKSIFPTPSWPLQYAPAVVIIWILAGCLLLWWMRRAGHEKWLLTAGQVFGGNETLSVGASKEQDDGL